MRLLYAWLVVTHVLQLRYIAHPAAPAATFKHSPIDALHGGGGRYHLKAFHDNLPVWRWSAVVFALDAGSSDFLRLTMLITGINERVFSDGHRQAASRVQAMRPKVYRVVDKHNQMHFNVFQVLA